MNNAKDLDASGMDFAPVLWLDPLLKSGNVFEAMCPESAYASADSDVSDLYVSKVEDTPISFTDVDRS